MMPKICNLLAVVMVMGIAGAAHADQKLYSGTECVALGSDQSVIEYNTGRAFNPTTSTRVFYCPAVLDRYKLFTADNFIYLWDRNYSADFRCLLRSQAMGSLSYYFKSASTSGTTAAPTRYNFTGTNSYYRDGMRYVYCTVPGVYSGNKSAIYGYSVNED